MEMDHKSNGRKWARALERKECESTEAGLDIGLKAPPDAILNVPCARELCIHEADVGCEGAVEPVVKEKELDDAEIHKDT